MTRIIRHEMPDPPPEHRRKHFTYNLLTVWAPPAKGKRPERLPFWLCPRVVEPPEGGRLVEKAAIRAPIFDDGDSIAHYRKDSIRAEQQALRYGD